MKSSLEDSEGQPFDNEVTLFLRQKVQEISFGRLQALDLTIGQDIFEDLGLDSLDFAELLYSTADHFNLVVEEDADWAELKTLEDMANHLLGQKKERPK